MMFTLIRVGTNSGWNGRTLTVSSKSGDAEAPVPAPPPRSNPRDSSVGSTDPTSAEGSTSVSPKAWEIPKKSKDAPVTINFEESFMVSRFDIFV